jgi:rRNA processing protein Krr1/Pno1
MIGANISVYGKTIGLIGTYDEISLAKDAIFDIIDGKPINIVYKNISMKK